MSKWMSEWMNESEWVRVWVSESVSEWECEWVREWVSEWVGGWVSEWVRVSESVWVSVSVSECEWVWVSVSECEWVWVSVSECECEWVWVSVSERVRGKEGRRRTEGASGYRTKNKNPTRQCGEQHGNNSYIIQYLTHITSNIRHIAHLWTWFFTVFHHYTYPSGPIRAESGIAQSRYSKDPVGPPMRRRNRATWWPGTAWHRPVAGVSWAKLYRDVENQLLVDHFLSETIGFPHLC